MKVERERTKEPSIILSLTSGFIKNPFELIYNPEFETITESLFRALSFLGEMSGKIPFEYTTHLAAGLTSKEAINELFRLEQVNFVHPKKEIDFEFLNVDFQDIDAIECLFKEFKNIGDCVLDKNSEIHRTFRIMSEHSNEYHMGQWLDLYENHIVLLADNTVWKKERDNYIKTTIIDTYNLPRTICNCIDWTRAIPQEITFFYKEIIGSRDSMLIKGIV
jgi:hypothetical protein